MRVVASSGALLGTGLAGVGFALTFFLLVWPLERSTAIGLGVVSTIFAAIAFAGAWWAYYRPEAATSSDSEVVLEGQFTHDPKESKPQGIFIRTIASPLRDIQVQPFGMKDAQVLFDEIPLLLPGESPKELTPRFHGRVRSVWEAAVLVELAKIQPVRVAKTVKGRLMVTAVPPTASRERRRMPLRIKFKDAQGKPQLNTEYFLQFVDSPNRIPIESRLIVRRDSAGSV